MRIVHWLKVSLFALAAFAVPVAAQDEETIDWFDNYDKAIEEARRTKKPIFLEFRCEA